MNNKFLEIPQGIAVAGCKIANLRRTNIMFNTLKNLVVTKTAKRSTAKRVSGLSKTQRVLNFLSSGKSISWKTLRTKFDLTSPRAMVDKLRAEGNMIYINKSAEGTSYRLGTPSKAIIAAGIQKLYGTKYAYSNN
jgi:hypothetical protein